MFNSHIVIRAKVDGIPCLADFQEAEERCSIWSSLKMVRRLIQTG